MAHRLTDDEWDALLVQATARAHDATRRKRDNPYVLDLIRVVPPLPRGISRSMTLHFVRKNRERLGLLIPRTFDDTVQQSLERYCIDSEVFKKRNASPDDGLFCWPKGAGAGHWAAISERVDTWLERYRAKRGNY